MQHGKQANIHTHHFCNTQNPLANLFFKTMTDVTGVAVIAKTISQITQKNLCGPPPREAAGRRRLR